MTVSYIPFGEHMCVFLFGDAPGGGISRSAICLAFVDIAKSFSSTPLPIHTAASHVWESWLPEVVAGAGSQRLAELLAHIFLRSAGSK